MSDEAFRAEWRRAPDFAEVAEALGVQTVDVLALLPGRLVLYTPDPDDPDPLVFKATLGRDADDILIASPGERVCRTSELIDGKWKP